MTRRREIFMPAMCCAFVVVLSLVAVTLMGNEPFWGLPPFVRWVCYGAMVWLSCLYIWRGRGDA